MANIKPITISVKDLGVPVIKVEAIRTVDLTEKGVTVVNPQIAWEKSADQFGPVIIITDIVGLKPSHKYRIQFLLSA